MDIEIGDDTFTKKPNILEEIAYRDTWGKGDRLLYRDDLRAADSDEEICLQRMEAFMCIVIGG